MIACKLAQRMPVSAVMFCVACVVGKCVKFLTASDNVANIVIVDIISHCNNQSQNVSITNRRLESFTIAFNLHCIITYHVVYNEVNLVLGNC